MRDKLIELLKETRCEKDCDGFQNIETCKACTAYERYAESADNILADGWIRPPCKVGDKVYEIVHGEILETEAVGFLVCQDGAILLITKHFFPLSREIGCCVFLTREEAEAALKGGAE